MDSTRTSSKRTDPRYTTKQLGALLAKTRQKERILSKLQIEVAKLRRELADVYKKGDEFMRAHRSSVLLDFCSCCSTPLKTEPGFIYDSVECPNCGWSRVV